jgi:hypothetical protein
MELTQHLPTEKFSDVSGSLRVSLLMRRFRRLASHLTYFRSSNKKAMLERCGVFLKDLKSWKKASGKTQESVEIKVISRFCKERHEATSEGRTDWELGWSNIIFDHTGYMIEQLAERYY